MKKVLSVILTLTVLLTMCLAPMTASASTSRNVKDGIVKLTEVNKLYKRTVYYPEELENSDQKYPICTWANGTGCDSEFYDKLLRKLAAGGYVVVASSEAMSNDGEDQCNGIDYLIDKGNNPDSKLYGKIDETRIAAAGHSQGGRSSVNAAAQDERIGCVISIAGSSYDYEAAKEKKPTLFLSGTSDLIVPPKTWIVTRYGEMAEAGVTVCMAELKGGMHTACISGAGKYARYSILWMNAFLNKDNEALKAFEENGKLSQDDDWTKYAAANMPSGFTASVFSDGNIFVIIGILAVILATVIVLFRKKKKNA